MSDDEAVPSFDDPAKETEYWRSKANALKSMLQEAEDGLKDFAESSKELEQEMERELAQSAKDLDDSRTRNEKLSQDKDEWKSKYQTSLIEHNKTLAEMSRELSQLRESHNIYKAKLRDMELDNDELENAERMVRSSLHDIEQRYNQQMEKTTLMEGELITKTQLEEENQRLRDEIRELNEEVAVLREREVVSTTGASRNGTPSDVPNANGYTAQEGELSLSDLTSSHKPTPSTSSRSGSAASIHSSRDRPSPGKPRQSQMPPSARVPLLPRKSVSIQSRPRVGQDLGKTITSEDRRASPGALRTAATPARLRPDMASSRALRTPRTTVRPGSAGVAGGASRKMMKDLLGNMSALQDRLHRATAFAPSPIAQSDPDRSALPRPSSRMGASVSGTPANRPRPSFDGRSSIPVASGGLNRSLRRPTSRLSMGPSRGGLVGLDDDSPEGADQDRHLPSRSMTPTMYTARARAHPNISTAATGLSRGPTSGGAGGATSPLDFLNKEPEGRPSSRLAQFTARDSLSKARRPSASHRVAHSRAHSTTVDAADAYDVVSSSSSSVAASSGSGSMGRPRGSTVTSMLSARRSTAAPTAGSSSSSSTALSSSPPSAASRGASSLDPRPPSAASSVAAFREARLHQREGSSASSHARRPSSSSGRPTTSQSSHLHRPLSGLSAAGGPPPPSWKKKHDPLMQTIHAAGASLRRSRSSSVGSEH